MNSIIGICTLQRSFQEVLNRGIEYDDIYQVAAMGLLAVNRFDVDKGFKFSSFATPTIVERSKTFPRQRLDDSRAERPELQGHVGKRLYRENHRVPTVSDIAQYLDTTDEASSSDGASKVYCRKVWI